MENPEEVLQSLDEFAKLKPKDIPRELEDYLSYVAKTGDPVYQWSIVKCLFREKLLNVITDFYETSPTIDLPPCPNVDPFNYETLKNSLLERLDSFPSAPFTVQRLCELLTTPRKEYSRADKFMRAIEKNILVVSTREPGHLRRNDNNGQPELLMNGVMDGRGIELGEAIETVSSDGVNLMHSDENEVNVTENESIPIECAGMEEIDMEEQGDNVEASNSNSWEKEQSDVSIQSEENGNTKDYDGNDGEKKTKENSETVGTDCTESEDSKPKLPISTENENVNVNVADTFSEEASGETQNEEDTSSKPSSSKENLEENDEKSELKADTSKLEESVPSEDSKPEDKITEVVGDETAENISQDISANREAVSEENSCSEQEPVDSSSTSENLSKTNTDTETVSVVETSTEETVAESKTLIETESSVTDRPNITESATEATASLEETCKSDSTITNSPPTETCEKSVDNDISAASSFSETDTTAVTKGNTEESTSDEVTSSAESESGTSSVEEVISTSSSAESVPYENNSENGDSKVEQESAEEAPSQQEEAMDVDDVNCQLNGADGDEPMDQSEQPTEGQVES